MSINIILHLYTDIATNTPITMLTPQELSNLEQGVYFQKLNCTGKGVGGCVYAINKDYVVKKVPNIGISIENKSFNRELETTIILSHHNIAPRVVYHSKNTEKYTYYVMERLNYTLMDMLDRYSFTEEHLIKLVYLLERLNKTQYRHGDLHINNIMWSEKHNDFRLIDWGIFYITKKTRKKQSPYLISELLKYVKKYYRNYSVGIFTFIKFGKIKSDYKNADRTKRPHYKVGCDMSGQCPIIGTRYHCIGKNYDLNETEFKRLSEKDKTKYEVIPYPGAEAKRYEVNQN